MFLNPNKPKDFHKHVDGLFWKLFKRAVKRIVKIFSYNHYGKQ